MALAWTSLTLDSSGEITVPSTFGGQSIQTYLRTVLGREVTYQEGDATFYDVQMRCFTLTPNVASPETLTRINGGGPGATQIMIRPGQTGWSFTIEDNANLHIPSGTIVLSEIWHCLILVRVGTDEYAKMLL